ncbi:MAG TPA: carbohydrate binding family 9 domain-containing protein, partial [Kofleriaceae bacterium]|nr:carbohydrate binding family 9 domain-containing protein [Kofleriaceae bacterium]
MIVLVILASLAPTRVGHGPHVDGHLDDAVWQTVPANTTFTQSFPNDGEAPSDPTQVKVAYDDDTLYVAIHCEQRAPVVARLTRRDREIDGDRVSIDLDTSADRRAAFHFQVSAAGVMVDGLRYDDTELITDWDEVWQAEVARTTTGWTAELAIPLRILRLRSGVETWGFQVRRWVGATGEEDEWAWTPRDSGGEVSR